MISFDYDSSYNPSTPVATITLRHPDQHEITTECTPLIDSGADGTMIPLYLLQNINAPLVGDGYMRGVLGVRELVDIYLVRIQIGPYSTGGIRAVAIANEAEPILGRNVINHFVITLNGLANTVKISS